MLIAAVSNLDNLAAGVAFGIRDARIAAAPNVVIAAVTTAATAAAVTSGGALTRVLSPSLAAALGASIICAIGASTVLASLGGVRAPRSSSEPGDCRRRGGRWLLAGELDRAHVISCREALVLGVALALNNVAAGVGAGVAGISPLATALLAGTLSLICLGGGSRLGLSLGRLLGGRWPSLISGLMLLGVGVAILSGAG